MVLDGPMNGAAFQAYVEQVLAPTLRPGDIVVLDHLPAHKPAAVRQAIEATGAELHFLPPYSPDFNPIEMAFAKLKAWLSRLPRERSSTSGTPSAPPSNSSLPPSAETTSRPQNTTSNDRKML